MNSSPLTTPLAKPPGLKRLGPLAAAAAAVLVLGCWALWSRHSAVARLRAELPAVPDVSGQPPALAAALQAAERKALSRRASLEGVADLGRLYQANDFNEQAEVCWRYLVVRQPAEGHWSHYLADLRRTAGDDAGMVEWLRETLRRKPDYAPDWLKLAEWEFKTGQTDEAERDYRRRLELLPGDPYASLGLARAALQREHLADARSRLEQIVRAHPAFYPAHNLLAEIMDQTGDAAGAKQQRALGRAASRFREADDPWLEELQAWCYNPSRLAVWASIELLTNHGDHGVALLERAIRLAPSDPLGYDDLGRLDLQLHAPEKARDLFIQAMAMPNAPSDVYAGLSEAYRDLKAPDLALRAAEQGLARLPGAADIEMARGNSLLAAGRFEEALAAFRRAAQSAPTVAETHYDVGNVLRRLGRADEAAQSFRRALELKPSYPPALLALGEMEMAAGRLADAETHVRALYDFDPYLDSARRLLAAWCLRSGDLAAKAGRAAEAEARLREGIAVRPDLAELHARLGLLYGQEGRFADALAPLETYRRLEPAEPMARLFLGQTYAHLGRTREARDVLREGEEMARRAGDTATAAVCVQAEDGLSP